MNQVNPANSDATLNVSPQVIIDAVDKGTIQNVKTINKKGDALVLVTNDGQEVTVNGQDTISLVEPSKKANTNLLVVSNTLNEKVDPETDTQVQFNMSMVLNILFELQEESYKSSNLAAISNMYASLANTKASAKELRTAAIVGLAFGVASGAIQMGAGAYGAVGEAKSLQEAGNQTVFREVSADDIAPQPTVDLGEIDGENVTLTEMTEEMTVSGEKVVQNDGTKGFTRGVRVDDQEFQTAYQSASRTRMAKAEIMKAVGGVGNSVGQGTSGIIQADSKKKDALAKMYDALQGMETQNLQKSLSLMQSVIGLIQSAGESQNQALGTIGQGMA